MGWFEGETGAPLHQILDVKKAVGRVNPRCSGRLILRHKKGVTVEGDA